MYSLLILKILEFNIKLRAISTFGRQKLSVGCVKTPNQYILHDFYTNKLVENMIICSADKL